MSVMYANLTCEHCVGCEYYNEVDGICEGMGSECDCEICPFVGEDLDGDEAYVEEI